MSIPSAAARILGSECRLELVRCGDVDYYRDTSHILMVATTDEGLRRLRSEAEGRAWAITVGVSVPEVLAVDQEHGWLISPWIEAHEPEGPQYVRSGLAGADAISKGALVRPATASTWRARRRDLAVRVTRMAFAGVNLQDFRARRAAAMSLPNSSMAHGDYYVGNVLRGAEQVFVVDWEFWGPAPKYTDHLRFWSTLRRREDRELAMDLISSAAGSQRRSLATLAIWLAYRLLAQNASAPPRQRNMGDLEHARRVVREAEDRFADLL